MTTSHELDDTRFDRLVDGELSPEEYRELLASLDQEPEGWRRCAMAFLEAQALGMELTSVRTEPQSAPLVVRRNRWWVQHGVPLAIACAASFALAFWFGGGMNRETGSGVHNTVAHEPVPELDEFAANLEPEVPEQSVPEHSVAEPVAHARFVVDGEQVDLPLYDERAPIAQRLLQRPVQIPEYLRRESQRAGYELRHRRELTPIQLEDGRQVIIPVDELEFTPVPVSFQ